MKSPELRQAWQEYKIVQEFERQVRPAEQTEKDRRNAIIQRNANRVGAMALALTEVTGWQKDEEDLPSRLGITRLSNPIPLGELDDTGTTQAFARIFVKHLPKAEPVVVPRRFLKPKVGSRLVPDKALEVGVRYYAKSACEEYLEMFASKNWSSFREDSQKDSQQILDEVEQDLADLGQRLKPQAPAE